MGPQQCILLSIGTQRPIPCSWLLLPQIPATLHAHSYYPMPPDNGPIHILCQIMWQVIASATKAELSTLFLNAQTACPICTALDEMVYSQLATCSKQITVQHVASSMTPSNKNAPRQLTCTFIGSVIKYAKDSFTSFGALAIQIVLIIFPNIIQPNTIKPCSTSNSNHCAPIAITMLPCYGSNQNILVRMC